MRWLRPVFRRSAVEREMDAELRFHYGRMVEDFERRGLAPEEARRRTRLEFGGLGQLKDDSREARLAGRIEGLWRGLRMAGKALAKSPGFTAVAVVTMALGIGVNTVMFSLMDHLLLRNLPVRDPQRLVVFHGNFTTPGMYRSNGRGLSFSWPKYTQFRDESTVFSGVAARFAADGSLEYRGSTEKIVVELVSGNYFDVLGVGPALGRVFTPADNIAKMGHPLAVLGYSYWQRRFGGDPGIVGQQVRVNGMPMTVVGISAAGFHSVDRGHNEDVRVPMTMKDLFTPGWPGLDRWDWAWLNIVARVQPGSSPAQAQAETNVLYRRILRDEAGKLSATYPRRREFLNDRVDLLPASGGMMDQTRDQRAFVEELMAIAGVVLMIACVNLAGLLLARTAGRHRELAIRLALGAGRLGVLRLLLAENLLLTALGGGAGLLLAIVTAQPAARLLISPEAGQLIDGLLDWRVLGFGLLLTTLTSVAFCAAPALQMRKVQLADVLKNESAVTSSRTHVRLRKTMVMAQLAFCVWLVMGAGLFAKSLAHLRAVDLGFHKEHLVTFQLDAMTSGYKSEETLATYRRVRDTLGALPGVVAVADSDYGVLTGGVNLNTLQIEGYRPPPSGAPFIRELVVSPGYLQAMNMPLRAGRDFSPADVPDVGQPPRVAIVNEAFARQYFGGKIPIGRRLGWSNQKEMQFEIVGLVADQRYDGPLDRVYPFYYYPYEMDGPLSFYVRTSLPPEALLSTIRRTVEQQAPGVPIDHLRTMDDLFDSTIGDQSRIASLATFFGLLATVLAAIGLYGVMAYTVARRTREIGLRIALGAARADVLGMVMREVGTVIALGLLVGLPSGLLLARLLRAQLHGVSPVDAPSLLAAAAMVAATALVAGILPARRATKVEPLRALRWE